MISLLNLKNFKSLREVSLPLRSLTLLSGVNGSGKSSVLQALAVMRQSYESLLLSDNEGGLLLNGEYVELGTGKDVLCEFSDIPEIHVGVEDQRGPTEWRFSYDGDEDVLRFVDNVAPSSFPDWMTGGFQFLKADRLVPAVVYPKSYTATVRRRWLGVRGQYTPHFLAIHQDDLVSDKRLINPIGGRTLLAQVNHWLAKVSPGVAITANEISGTDLAKISFNFGGRAGLTASNAYRPTNVGFGLTYCLPIIVACLSARQGDLLLLENPEAHLHPKGQSAMGGLLALAAADGVQVLVESHSDHLLNGIRMAVKQEEIKPGDVALRYFLRGDGDQCSTFESPQIDARGRIDHWPDGFFDEWERSLMELI